VYDVERIYREHGASVLAYLRHKIGPEAEDVLQETFVQVLRRPDALAEVRSVRAWLLAIAHNLAANTLRKRGRHRVAGQVSARPQPRATEEEIEPRLEDMYRAIDTLPDEQREVLYLRLHERLSYAEIADVQGVPVGTVGSRVHHAVGRLREIMNNSK
jgi:RNA polymerase sigma-70 factor (ECF subfamily)